MGGASLAEVVKEEAEEGGDEEEGTEGGPCVCDPGETVSSWLWLSDTVPSVGKADIIAPRCSLSSSAWPSFPGTRPDAARVTDPEPPSERTP